jgi:hypothetical protein
VIALAMAVCVLGAIGVAAALAHRLPSTLAPALFPVILADLAGMGVRPSAVAGVIGGIGFVLLIVAVAVALLAADTQLSMGWWRPFRRLLKAADSSRQLPLGTDEARRRG